MTAEIIVLPVVRVERSGDGDNPCNGALQVVRDYLVRVHPARTMARMLVDDFEGLDVLVDPDHFLAWLWEQGYKIERIG